MAFAKSYRHSGVCPNPGEEVLGDIAGVVEAIDKSLPASLWNSPVNPLFVKEGVARSAGGVEKGDCRVALRHKRAITEGSPLQDSSQRSLAVIASEARQSLPLP